MAKILTLETATKVCSVSIFENNELIDCIEEHGSYSHAENLAQFVDQLLSRNHIAYSQLDALAISKGPGSYTGLRIGVAFAKGLCFAQNIPLIAINSLESLAWGAIQEIKQKEFLVCSMIDARRMEVYAAIYNQDLKPIRKIGADVVNEQTYMTFLDNNLVYFIGDGAEKCKNQIKHDNARFEKMIHLSSKYLGEMAYKKFLFKNFEDLAYFEPLYLKEFLVIKSKKVL